MIERCGDCQFFAKDEKQCRRHAPKVFLVPGALRDGISTLGVWPPADATAWCGEFRPKQEA